MLDKIVFLMKKNRLILAEDDEIVVKYGLELLFNTVISVSVLMIIGILMGYFKETILFYLTYLFLKKNTGGYHANSHLGCVLQFNSFCLIIFLLYRYSLLPICETAILFLLIVSVFFFAPVEDHNKEVLPDQLLLHKHTCRRNTIFLVILCICLKLLHVPTNSMYNFFYLGMLMISITILLGSFKNHLTKDGK